MSLPDNSVTFSVAKLPKERYDSLQDLLNDFAAALQMTVPDGFFARKGDKGEPGSTTGISTHITTIPVGSGQQTINIGFDLSQCIVNCVSTSGAPTVGVLCVFGTSVRLTSAAPDATYSIVVTQLSK